MQAQVEPHFLFDVLVDVQQQYALGQGEAAAEQMERLIHHLRVALPRLREQNVTTLDAEADINKRLQFTSNSRNVFKEF